MAGSLATADAGTITLVVPSYDYAPSHATVTIAEGVANNGTVVGSFGYRRRDAGYTRTPQGRFSRPLGFPGVESFNARGGNYVLCLRPLMTRASPRSPHAVARPPTSLINWRDPFNL